MPRTDLDVPFSEKDDAKRVGAKWDLAKKVWYIPDGVDVTPFSRWLPKAAQVNARSTRYYIAENVQSCWSCGQPTRVFGFLLPEGYESLEDIDDEDTHEARSVWEAAECAAFVYYIEHLPEQIKIRMMKFTGKYRMDFSKTTNSRYWMNHCDACDAKQGDFMLYCEPEGAFSPIDSNQASDITLHPVNEPFEARSGGQSLIYEDFDSMKIAKR